MNFKKWFEDVYRIDKERVGNFSDKLRNYYRNQDWSSSGTFDDNPPSDWHKETGLFAGKLKDVIPYVLPRRWIQAGNTIILDEKDKNKIGKSYLSRFPSDVFNKVPSGEYFSNNPGRAAKQELIRKPLKFIRRWYDMKFVPDLDTYVQELKSKGIQFNSEGLP